MIFDRILVGVDESEHALGALAQAIAVRSPDGVVLAVTVLESALASRAGFEAPRALARLTEAATDANRRAAALLEGTPGEARIVRGHRALQTLLELAAAEGSTLVVAGTAHRARAAGIVLGRVSTGLLHDAPCSVFVGRPRADEPWRPQRILVGLDGSDSSLAALGAADDLAARLGSSVDVLAATSGKPIDVEADGAAGARVTLRAAEHPVDALVGRSSAYDLVVVGSRGLHGVRALGSVSEQVAHRASCSVLVVRDASRAVPAQR